MICQMTQILLPWPATFPPRPRPVAPVTTLSVARKPIDDEKKVEQATNTRCQAMNREARPQPLHQLTRLWGKRGKSSSLMEATAKIVAIVVVYFHPHTLDIGYKKRCALGEAKHRLH